MMNKYKPINSYIFRGFLAIPFIFELRSIVDWTFTKTALDVFQWIKLAQIQADLYVAKCVNKTYMEKPIGKPIKCWMKILIGGGLTLLVILLLAGPILLFSSYNPIAVVNPVLSANLEVRLEI